MTQQTGELHAVKITGWSGFRRMAIHGGVDPDQPEQPVTAQRVRGTGPGTDGTAVIAAQHRKAGFIPNRIAHRIGDRASCS